MPLLYVLLAVAVVAWKIRKDLTGQAVRARGLVALPIVLAFFGVRSYGHQDVTDLDLVLLGCMAVAAIAAGAIRGYVVVLSERDGYLYQHSTWIGIAVWAAVLVVRLTLDVVAHVAGAAMAERTAPLLLSLALLLAVQNGVIALRALDAGLPFAPRRRRAVRA